MSDATHHLEREAAPLLKQYAAQFRAVLVVGPRQSGKTTLVRTIFPQKPYASLEDPDQRMLAEDDPRAFLSHFPEGAILDEVQTYPRAAQLPPRHPGRNEPGRPLHPHE